MPDTAQLPTLKYLILHDHWFSYNLHFTHTATHILSVTTICLSTGVIVIIVMDRNVNLVPTVIIFVIIFVTLMTFFTFVTSSSLSTPLDWLRPIYSFAISFDKSAYFIGCFDRRLTMSIFSVPRPVTMQSFNRLTSASFCRMECRSGLYVTRPLYVYVCNSAFVCVCM